MALLWALNAAPISSTTSREDLRDRLVLIALAARADQEGTVTRLDVPALAPVAGVQHQDVLDALESLEGAGLLRLELTSVGLWVQLDLTAQRPGANLFGHRS